MRGLVDCIALALASSEFVDLCVQFERSFLMFVSLYSTLDIDLSINYSVLNLH